MPLRAASRWQSAIVWPRERVVAVMPPSAFPVYLVLPQAVGNLLDLLRECLARRYCRKAYGQAYDDLSVDEAMPLVRAEAAVVARAEFLEATSEAAHVLLPSLVLMPSVSAVWTLDKKVLVRVTCVHHAVAQTLMLDLAALAGSQFGPHLRLGKGSAAPMEFTLVQAPSWQRLQSEQDVMRALLSVFPPAAPLFVSKLVPRGAGTREACMVVASSVKPSKRPETADSVPGQEPPPLMSRPSPSLASPVAVPLRTDDSVLLLQDVCVFAYMSNTVDKTFGAAVAARPPVPEAGNERVTPEAVGKRLRETDRVPMRKPLGVVINAQEYAAFKNALKGGQSRLMVEMTYKRPYLEQWAVRERGTLAHAAAEVVAFLAAKCVQDKIVEPRVLALFASV